MSEELHGGRGGHPVGFGVLEEFLAKRRSQVAGRRIPVTHRRGRILDIGCGSHPLFLIRAKESVERYGLDRFGFVDHGGAANGHGITLVNHDLEREPTLPFGSGYFDVVSMLAVVEHIPPSQLTDVLQEVRRVLRPGGLCVVTTPCYWTGPLLKMMATCKLVSAYGVAEHKAAYSPAQLVASLQEGGFAREQIRFGYFEAFMNSWVTAIA